MLSTDPNFPLSKNFKLWEFTTSQTATRWGINNQPGNEHVVRLKRLCEQVIQPARDALGPIRVSSGYRCPALNQAVRGSRTSQHMRGEAADLIPLECSKRQLLDWILTHVVFDQLINEFPVRGEPSWIHVSLKQSHNRRQVFRIG